MDPFRKGMMIGSLMSLICTVLVFTVMIIKPMNTYILELQQGAIVRGYAEYRSSSNSSLYQPSKTVFVWKRP